MKKPIIRITERQKSYLLADQSGVAIISALLILMLLSFVAVISTHTVLTEQRMVRSEAVFEQNFYLAESAALEGVQKLENESSPDELLPKLLTGTSKNKDLLVASHDKFPHNDYANLDLDDDDDSGDEEDFAFDEDDRDKAESSSVNPDAKRIVAQMPLPPGSSLALGGQPPL